MRVQKDLFLHHGLQCLSEIHHLKLGLEKCEVPLRSDMKPQT